MEYTNMSFKATLTALACVVVGVCTLAEAAGGQPGNEGGASLEGLAALLLSEEGEAYRKRVGEFAALAPEGRAKVLETLDAKATPLAHVVASALRCRVDSPEMVAAFEVVVQKARADAPLDQIGRKMYGEVLSKLPREVFYQSVVAEAVVKGLDPDPRMLRSLVYKLPAPYPPVNETVTPEDAVRAVVILAAADKIDDYGQVVDRLLRILARVSEQQCDEAFMESYRRFREREVKSEWSAREAVLALPHLDTRRALPIAEAVRGWEHERMRQLPIVPWQDESALEHKAKLLSEQSRLTDTNGGTYHARLAQIELQLQETDARWRRKALWNTIEKVVKELREKAAAAAQDGLSPEPK